MSFRSLRALLCVALLVPGAATAAGPAPVAGGPVPVDDADHVSEALIERLAAEARGNIAAIQKAGKLPAVVPKVSGLVWPLGPTPGHGTDWHGISNFVDLDPAFPQKLLDYNGGARTYDLESGYNHRGIDYFVHPFGWHLLDTGAVEVRAVAPGTLVGRGDGNDDRSCSFNAPDTPNYVSIRHADNTVAYYLHLKKGSVTTLPIGANVPAGTVLGRVGSSGISSGPHLHLELRASSAAGAAVIEPHTGPANPGPSLWASQRDYRDSALNRLSTHSAVPSLPQCPGTTMPTGVGDPLFKDRFQPGEAVTLAASYRDQGKGQVTQYRLLRPDLSVQQSWTHSMPASAPDYYTASWWFWQPVLPADAPHGLWHFEATYEGKTTRHAFHVGNTTTAIGDMRGLIGAWYEPDTSGQGFELHWINGGTALLFFYGHHDDGQNFFLLGQRDAPWDFGQEVEFEMYATTGGRWTDLDPALIQRPTWGTLRITFVDCENAVAELDGADGVQVLSLERLGRTDGLSCD